MLRTNTAADVANTGMVTVDAGEGVTVEVPTAPVPNLAARLAALEYDSGERNITGLISADTWVSGALHAERTGKYVSLQFLDLVGADQGATWVNFGNILPPGLRPRRGFEYFPIGTTSGADAAGPVRVSSSGNVLVYGAADGLRVRGRLSFPTSEAPPTTPPGAPA